MKNKEVFSFVCMVSTVLFVCIGLSGCLREKEEVTFSSCLRNMTNLTHFADVPIGTAMMISSYDRTGGNRDWADFSSLKGGGRVIIADLEGPGCVNRIWYTNIPKCKWLFFFDGEKMPSMQLSGKGLTEGDLPFIKPLAVGESGGTCIYVPLPYEKSLRIELEFERISSDSRPYFHINYENFPKGTAVASFNPVLSENELMLVESVCEFWQDLPPLMCEGQNASFSSSHIIRPGAIQECIAVEGAGIIDTIRCRFNTTEAISAVNKNNLLRELWLRIYWDGSDSASVDVPLGDFFCNGLARRRLNSLPVRVTDKFFISGFPMPFRHGFKIVISNRSRFPVEFDMDVFASAEKPRKPLRYFHATWNQSQKSGHPYQVISTTGKGHFVGCYMNSFGMDGTWNNLEGDELFSVDGVPSLFGTGLEDYFNGGWYYKGLFERPLHGLIDKAAMRTSQYRFHLTTPIAFEKSLDCSFQFGTANHSKAYFSSVAYWYGSKAVSAGSLQVLSRSKLRGPIDNVAVASMMSELFELERGGYIDECCERSKRFSEILSRYQYGDIYRVRALAYHALRGDENISAQIAALEPLLAKDGKGAQELKLFTDFYSSSSNALISAHSGASFKLFLDDAFIGSGNSPVELSSFSLSMNPGEHMIRVELKAQPKMSYINWFSLGLTTHSTNIVSDKLWEYSMTRPSGWPENDGDESLWSPVYKSSYMLPSMSVWQFVPNAMVCTQSGKQLIVPYKNWNQREATVYLRRRFIQPDIIHASMSNVRKISAEGDSVRPADDISNMNLD